MYDVIDRYDRIQRSLEDQYKKELDDVLESGFNRLVRRVKQHLRLKKQDPVQRNIQLLEEFAKLIPRVAPERGDPYNRIFRNLIQKSNEVGLTRAAATSEEIIKHKRLDVTIPLEATAAAVVQSRTYLQRHGVEFAKTAASTVAQGIAEGRPNDAIVGDMRQRLGVLRSRGEVIVRTEALRAHNKAAKLYYTELDIEAVMYYASADERTCYMCAPRAGHLYKIDEIEVPLHPRCRCFLAPWVNTPETERARLRHIEEVSRAYQTTNGQSIEVNLNRAAVFERLAPTPLL